MLFYSANEALPHLCDTVMAGGKYNSRNGNIKEAQSVSFTLSNPTSNPYIINPERKVSLPAQIAETMWVLAGRNDVDWLSNYLPRAKDFSDDGETWRAGYGPRIRDWQGSVDQLQHVVNLLNEDPLTRRAVISLYDPVVDSQPGKDIACNNWLHFLHRDGKLNLNVATRSNDLMWGWSGINTFEWTALLAVVSGMTGLTPGSITFNVSSLHLYEPYWPKADRISDTIGRIEGSSKDYTEIPLEYVNRSGMSLDMVLEEWFDIEEGIRSGEVMNDRISTFPVTMFRHWLEALDSWWSGTPMRYPYQGTTLKRCLDMSPRPRPKKLLLEPRTTEPTKFTEFVSNLHREKHEAYGDSWSRRGEMLGIMANIARKVDRLGVAGGGDTSADTAIDLLVYLVKYRGWLVANGGAALPAWVVPGKHPEEYSGTPEEVTAYLLKTQDLPMRAAPTSYHIGEIKELFDDLERLVEEKDPYRYRQVNKLLDHAYPLAAELWFWEQLPKTRAERNATRRWAGYNPEDIDAMTGD